MSDLKAKIDEASSRILAAQKELAEAEADRNRHETAAKTIRDNANKARLAANAEAAEQEELSRQADARYQALKKELEQLNAVLRHTVVAKTVEDSAAAQKKAQEEVEATLSRLREKEKETDSLKIELEKTLAKAKDQLNEPKPG